MLWKIHCCAYLCSHRGAGLKWAVSTLKKTLLSAACHQHEYPSHMERKCTNILLSRQESSLLWRSALCMCVKQRGLGEAPVVGGVFSTPCSPPSVNHLHVVTSQSLVLLKSNWRLWDDSSPSPGSMLGPHMLFVDVQVRRLGGGGA